MVIRGIDDNLVVARDTDHIRDWIEKHGGQPAIKMEGVGNIKLGIKFEDENGKEELDEIPW